MSPGAYSLPLQLSSFVGREREMAEVKALLERSCLVTLSGPGGCGKSARALRVVAQSRARYADDVCWVELAPLADAALVPQAVARALGLLEASDRPLGDRLLEALREKELLLVLDNCEHLIDACARLATDLLQGCLDLHILATSREALNISGEVAWIVPSMRCPEVAGGLSTVELARYDAVRLFVERVTSALPGFKLGEQNAALVLQICRRLDGMPLALELAAARARVLSVEQIAARLNDALRLLSGGRRGSPQRHQTLRAALDWSHDLLSPPEQRIFRRLSVFAGDFSLAGAEAVCPDDELRRDDILNGLMHLLDKSLVLRQAGNGEARYRLLEPVRQYAAEKLAQASELASTRERHLRFCLELAERAEPELQGPTEVESARRIDIEHDNIRAALDWSLDNHRPALGLRLATAVAGYWYSHGYWGEGLGKLEALLAAAKTNGGTSPDSLTRARALRAAGHLAGALHGRAAAQAHFTEAIAIARSLGGAGKPILGLSLAYLARWPWLDDPVTSRPWAEEALAIGRELGDRLVTTQALIALAWVSRAQGDLALARTQLESARHTARQHGSQAMYGIVLANLPDTLLVLGDYAAVRTCLAESLAIARAAGPKRSLSNLLLHLAQLEAREGDLSAAQVYSTERLTLDRALGSRQNLVRTLVVAGDIARLRHDFAAAYVLLGENLRLEMQAPHAPGVVAYLLRSFAHLAAAQTQPERAARLFAAGEALRDQRAENPRLYVFPGREAFEQAVAALRGQMSAAAWAAAWAAGSALSPAEALAEAERVTLAQESAQTPALPALSAREPDALTPRELEVLRWLAQGLSDAQIAEQLVISPRTVNSHLRSIFSKLNVTTRTAAARYAAEFKLQ